MSRRIRYEDEHALLRDEARRWLAERCTPADLRRLARDPVGDDPDVWETLAAMGWTGLLVPEAYGGAGLGALHLAVLSEECGRRLLPSPLLATQMAGLLIARAGDEAQRARWLPGIADGSLRATFAPLDDDGAPPARLVDGRLEGVFHHVTAAPTAALLVVPVETPEGPRLACLEAATCAVEAEVGLDPSRRRGRVRVAGAAPAADAFLARDAGEARRETLPWRLVALAAEMAGGTDTLLTLTAEYAATRRQFGRAIGSFQAVKHPLVDVLVELEHLRSLVYGAATALEDGRDDALLLARMAKAQASEVYPFAASRAVQLHGGFGFTEDCDAHLYLRRAQCSRADSGDAVQHRVHVA
ncbi:MAG: acyl-CoA dehydrogenase family protein, partial [Myxococcota bacterium]|nr:acyl-CoA dehydrogenase family protein [Myxococcota bacterium]